MESANRQAVSPVLSQEARPTIVTAAVILLYSALGVSALGLLLGSLIMFHPPYSRIVGLCIVLSLIVPSFVVIWFISRIAKGRNWARITYLVLCILDIIPQTFHLGAVWPLDYFRMGLQVAGLLLLFQKSSSHWFRQRKTKTTRVYCASIPLLIVCAFLSWGWLYIWHVFVPGPSPLSTTQVRKILEQSTNQTEIQAEVDNLFSRFGGRSKSLYGSDLTASPELARFAKALNGEVLGIWWHDIPKGVKVDDVPSHVRIRFGEHRHYQFIFIFPTGTDLSAIKPPFEQVAGNVYFEP